MRKWQSNPKRKLFLLLFLVLIAAAAIWLLSGSFNPGPVARFRADGYRIAYSGTNADRIRFQPSPDDPSVMQALILLGQREVPVFTMAYNTPAGDFTIMAGQKEKIPFAFTMCQPPDTLTSDEVQTFWQAQAIVNELPAYIKVR